MGFVRLSLCFLIPSFAYALELELSPWREAINDDKSSVTWSRVTEAGIDLNKSWDPQIVIDYDSKRLFHLFYTKLKGLPRNQDWAIQRIKKITRDFKSATDSSPAEKTEYLVEIFKVKGTEMKAEDQHHGNYPIGKYFRREIIKTADIGYGEIIGLYQGASWPLDKTKRYQSIEDYSAASKYFEAVKFTDSVTYSFKVIFEKNGHFLFDAPELKLRANEK